MKTFKVKYENIQGVGNAVMVDASIAADAVNAAKAGDSTFLKLISVNETPGEFSCSSSVGLGEDSAPSLEKKPWQSESLRPVQGAMDGVPFGR